MNSRNSKFKNSNSNNSNTKSVNNNNKKNSSSRLYSNFSSSDSSEDDMLMLEEDDKMEIVGNVDKTISLSSASVVANSVNDQTIAAEKKKFSGQVVAWQLHIDYKVAE